MTEAFYVWFIPRRMQELGFGDDYYLFPRHFVLQPGAQITVKGGEEFFFLLEPGEFTAVHSDFGRFDRRVGSGELQYEFKGSLTLINLDSQKMQELRFIQAVPKHQPHGKV